MTLEQLPDAELEVIEAVGYYERQEPGPGLEFLGAVEQAYQTRLEAPERWARLTPRTRRHRIGRIP